MEFPSLAQGYNRDTALELIPAEYHCLDKLTKATYYGHCMWTNAVGFNIQKRILFIDSGLGHSRQVSVKPLKLDAHVADTT